MFDYAASTLDLDESRWYFTQFFAEYYRKTDSWQEQQKEFEHTCDVLEALVDSYLEAGVFGPDELTALKFVTQTSGTVGIDVTRTRIQDTSGASEPKERALDLLDEDELGIVGGQAFHIQHVDDDAETTLLDAFRTLADETATTSEWDEAVDSLLALDIHNVGIATWSPIFCLLRPTRYPIVNTRSAKGMDRWFRCDIPTDADSYFETIEKFEAVCEEFRFDENRRQLDWFFHWTSKLTDVQSWYEENNIGGRNVWQINVGKNANGEPERLWPVWYDEGICSIGWDIGNLRTMSNKIIEEKAAEYEGERQGTYLKRFGKEMDTGQIVIARNGQRILGIGITQENGYQYCTDWIEGETDGVHHPHVWPVEWQVLVDETRPDTGQWDVSKGLHPRETLLKVKNFEELRFAFGEQEPSIQENITLLEQYVDSPTTGDLPALCSSTGDHEPITDPAPYYWVNQGLEEVENEYLRAPTRELFQYDLPKLEVGDKVFSYNDGQVLGYHTVTEPARIVQVPVEELDDPEPESGSCSPNAKRSSSKFFTFKSVSRGCSPFETSHWPVSGRVSSTNTCHSTGQKAGEYLLEKGGGEKTYDSLEEAEEEIRASLEDRSTPTDGLRAAQVKTTIKNWTKTLRRNDLAGKSVRRGDFETLSEIKSVYESYEESLKERAAKLNVGSLNQCSPAQVLFIVLIRELQREADVSQPNLNHDDLPQILNETYKDESTLEPPHADLDDPAELERQLRAKHQLIFHGPPGTSKTFTAQQFARWWLHKTTVGPTKDQLRTVTFHPSFSYEDFIEGLTAKQGEDGAVEYKVESGVFREFATRAEDAYKDAGSLEEAPNYVLVIDEINRGNLAQIFGETITLLEDDKRLDGNNETSMTLPHSGEEFYVPPNLYVIGTMNTADRSIALVDAALRRRFRFVHFGPDLEIVCEQYGFPGGDLDGAKAVARDGDDRSMQLLALSVCAIDALNAEIREARDLGRGKQIGHTALLGIDDEDVEGREQAILDTWRYEIMPLLEEYYFGQFDRIDEDLFDGNGDALFNSEAQEISDFNPQELATAITRIVDGLDDIRLGDAGA